MTGQKAKTVSLVRVKRARSTLLDVYNEYSPNLSERYLKALSDVRSLLADIQGDLEERKP